MRDQPVLTTTHQAEPDGRHPVGLAVASEGDLASAPDQVAGRVAKLQLGRVCCGSQPQITRAKPQLRGCTLSAFEILLVSRHSLHREREYTATIWVVFNPDFSVMRLQDRFADR